jgi:hypothetical protein
VYIAVDHWPAAIRLKRRNAIGIHLNSDGCLESCRFETVVEPAGSGVQADYPWLIHRMAGDSDGTKGTSPSGNANKHRVCESAASWT